MKRRNTTKWCFDKNIFVSLSKSSLKTKELFNFIFSKICSKSVILRGRLVFRFLIFLSLWMFWDLRLTTNMAELQKYQTLKSISDYTWLAEVNAKCLCLYIFIFMFMFIDPDFPWFPQTRASSWTFPFFYLRRWRLWNLSWQNNTLLS